MREALPKLAAIQAYSVASAGGFLPQNAVSVNAASLKAIGYTVSYDIQSDWGSGAIINVTIKNTADTAINGWKLVWTFAGNQKISTIWNATYTRKGTVVTIGNAVYNSNFPIGGTLYFGFIIRYKGTNSKPTSFKLNGVTNVTTTATPVVTITPGASASIRTAATPTAAAATTTTTSDYKNPDDYLDKTAVTVLAKSAADISNRTTEFTGLVANCTKIAYTYAVPQENANSTYNKSKSGAASFAAYIFGYDSTTEGCRY